MFEESKPRYLTRGVDAEIPFELQLFMWTTIEKMPKKRDYLQVFNLSAANGLQMIEHSAEQPEFHMIYVLAETDAPVTAKVYVIDSESYCTMLLAEEY